MVYTRQPMRPGGLGGGLMQPVPREVWIVIAVVFATFSLRFFASTAWLPAALELTPDVWERGFLWQLVTYAFVGRGTSGLWLLISLAIFYIFAGQVYGRLGRRSFWRVLVGGVVVGGVVAALVQLVSNLAGGVRGAGAFPVLQGERMLVVVLIAAFATLAGHAVIYLFFVLPVRASWFIGLELLFAFIGFLNTRDLAGMLGVWAAVGYTVLQLRGGMKRGGLRELWLRLQERWFRLRLKQMKAKRGLEVLPGGKKDKKDDWLH